MVGSIDPLETNLHFSNVAGKWLKVPQRQSNATVLSHNRMATDVAFSNDNQFAGKGTRSACVLLIITMGRTLKSSSYNSG